MKKKMIALVVALVMVVGAAVGGTLAWLVDTTGPVENTFTYGDINITLTETSADNDLQHNEYKMIPGNTIAKDPKVTVEAGSEACWLFVKIEKSANFDNFMTYTIADGWMQLKDASDNVVAGVYYREVSAATADQEFYVLTGNDQNTNGIVTVKNTVTKSDLNALTNDTYPTLTFTAYAVQKANVDDVATAWSYANPTT